MESNTCGRLYQAIEQGVVMCTAIGLQRIASPASACLLGKRERTNLAARGDPWQGRSCSDDGGLHGARMTMGMTTERRWAEHAWYLQQGQGPD